MGGSGRQCAPMSDDNSLSIHALIALETAIPLDKSCEPIKLGRREGVCLGGAAVDSAVGELE